MEAHKRYRHWRIHRDSEGESSVWIQSIGPGLWAFRNCVFLALSTSESLVTPGIEFILSSFWWINFKLESMFLLNTIVLILNIHWYARVLGPVPYMPCTWSLDGHWEVTETFRTWSLMGHEGCALNRDCESPVSIPPATPLSWILCGE